MTTKPESEPSSLSTALELRCSKCGDVLNPDYGHCKKFGGPHKPASSPPAEELARRIAAIGKIVNNLSIGDGPVEIHEALEQISALASLSANPGQKDK